jgi:protein TonB
VLTRAEDVAAPADFTDFSIATGHAESFAGGYTSGNGTSHTAVTSPVTAARKPAPNPRPSSLARLAEPLRKDWSCGWPEEAIDSDLRETRVAVRVAVGRDGDAQGVQVQGAAMSGFLEAARRCALDEQYRPALDVEGHRVEGETGLLIVHFVR